MNPAATPTKAFHVWFSTKGRRPALVQEIREAVLSSLARNAVKAGATLIEVEAIEDHVHLLLRLPANRALSSVMHQLKGASARELFHKYPELRLDMGGNSFWQKSYGARLVPDDQIHAVRRYIRTQSQRTLRHE